MHELALTEDIVAICVEHAAGAPVTKVTLEVGQLAGVLPDALRLCFALCAEGTPLAGAALEIVEPRGRGRCRDCGAERALSEPFGLCEACGSADLALVCGQQLAVRSIELADVPPA